MKKIRLTNEEMEYLRTALTYYCDLATHEKGYKDDEGMEVVSPGLPDGKESRILDNIRRRLI